MRFNFDDEAVQDVGVKFPKLDLKKDEVARVCAITPYFDGTVRHWVNRMGYVHCLATMKSWQDLIDIERDGGRPDECVLCRMALDPETSDMVGFPMRHLATYVLRYHTDVRGQLLHNTLGYHLEVWLLSNKKYRELMSIQKEWGSLQRHDLEITCVEQKYQNFDIDLKKEALWEKATKEDQAKIITYMKEEIEKYPLMRCLGDDVDIAVLKRRFAVASRRRSPDDQVELSPAALDAVLPTESDIPSVVEKGSDPFTELAPDGNIPSALTEEEKEKAEAVPEAKKGTLDALIP